MGKFSIRKGDLVEVRVGKDKGKRGIVLRVFPKVGKVLVQGVNFVKKHARPTQSNPQGGIITKEAPISISNVALFCPKCNRGRRVRRVVLSDTNEKVRVCVRCGEILGKESKT